MLLNLNEVKPLIERNEILFLAGDEAILEKLPKGNWIAGTIPYFMTSEGGLSTKEKIFTVKMADYIKEIKINFYTESNIKNIAEDAPENGFSYLIIPATSKPHIYYAQNAPSFKNLFLKPIIGWISGVHLNDLGKITPKVFNGRTLEKSESKAVVMHLTLPKNKIAQIGIMNIFNQGKGDAIEFDAEGFKVNDCLINGKKQNFAEYILKNKIDIKLPLVANYLGAMINVSFQTINEKDKTVDLYAPVFKGVQYKIAEPLKDYVRQFSENLNKEKINPVFSCNCILNYLYSELENKKTGNITGPVTFGEIAYQLLNQTLVYLEIKDV